jgi:hypothetical protein
VQRFIVETPAADAVEHEVLHAVGACGTLAAL